MCMSRARKSTSGRPSDVDNNCVGQMNPRRLLMGRSIRFWQLEEIIDFSKTKLLDNFSRFVG